jgi:transposase
LEKRFETLLMNARPVNTIPDPKTDVADAAWLAQLLRRGLSRASFISPPPTPR